MLLFGCKQTRLISRSLLERLTYHRSVTFFAVMAYNKTTLRDYFEMQSESLSHVVGVVNFGEYRLPVA